MAKNIRGVLGVPCAAGDVIESPSSHTVRPRFPSGAAIARAQVFLGNRFLTGRETKVRERAESRVTEDVDQGIR